MNPRSLTRAAIVLALAFLAAVLLVAFFKADAKATAHCIATGGTVADCGWR